jgi:hypothetical protein
MNNSTASRKTDGTSHWPSEVDWYPDGYYVVETTNGGKKVEVRAGIQKLGLVHGGLLLFDEEHNRPLRLWYPPHIVSIIWDWDREAL